MTDRHPDPAIRDDEQLRVVKNTDLDRYELWRGEQFIGFEGFQDHEDGTVELQHTIIGEQFGRQGYARTLVTLVLDRLREQDVRIRPTCSYVADYLERFPRYRDMVADG